MVEEEAILFGFAVGIIVVWTEVVIRGFDVFFFDAEFSEGGHDFVHGCAILFDGLVSCVGFDIEAESDFGDVWDDIGFAGGFDGDFAWIVAADALPSADTHEYSETSRCDHENCEDRE